MKELWQAHIKAAVRFYLEPAVTKGAIDASHVSETPERFVKALEHYISGLDEKPESYLEKQFSNGRYDEMIHVRQVIVMSMCAHHLCPIVGKAHFAYVPNQQIVGLSKIPRMIRALSRRPQVQENLTEQIVDIFQAHVGPKGCAVHLRCLHFCMIARGVEEPFSYTETTALRGCFKTGQARDEFLGSINKQEAIFP